MKYTWTVYYDATVAGKARMGEVTVAADTIEAATVAAKKLLPAGALVKSVSLDKELSKPRLDPVGDSE